MPERSELRMYIRLATAFMAPLPFHLLDLTAS